jgi:large subunit ribosomal protein L4
MIVQEYDFGSDTILQKEVSEDIFKTSVSENTITDVVIATKNNNRQGSACAKTRAEVSYSTRKPWKQKGTGRARAGMRKSPIWVKGGVIFPPRPRSFKTALPKKVKKLAFKSALYMKLQEQNLFLIRNFNSSFKTKEVIKNFKKMPFLTTPREKALIIYDEGNSSINLALRNVMGEYLAIPWDSVCTYDVVKSDKVLITTEAFENLGKRLENV